MSLVFADDGATNQAIFAKDFEELGQQSPMALKWPDRRPIGTAFIAQSATGWPGNPRGFITGLRDKEDIRTEAGLAAFGKSLLEYAVRCVTELKDKNAQGVIVWDIEGQERPHCISYVGDPRKLPQVAPEMDRFADAFMKKFRDAGFRTGVTLRPTDYYEPTPGKRDWTHREVKDPVALMSEKIQYARRRWGTTLFYLDSNVFNQDWGKFPPGADVPWIMPSRMIQKLNELHPDCLVIPEWSAGDFYRWSAPYSSPNIGQLTTSARDPFARVKWPEAFGVVAVESNLLETFFDTYVNGVAGGDILLFRCWYHDGTADMVKLIYREADLKRRLAGRPAAGLSDLVADAASPDEFRRYASACGLARFKDPAAPAAAAALLDDPSGAVRRAALEAIKTQARVAGPAVIDKLVAMLEADDPRSRLLRQGVAEALAAQGEAVVPAMRGAAGSQGDGPAALRRPMPGGLRHSRPGHGEEDPRPFRCSGAGQRPRSARVGHPRAGPHESVRGPAGPVGAVVSRRRAGAGMGSRGRHHRPGRPGRPPGHRAAAEGIQARLFQRAGLHLPGLSLRGPDEIDRPEKRRLARLRRLEEMA